MASPKTLYTCNDCGATSPRWLGKCPGCGAWNTLVESAAEAPAPYRTSRKSLRLLSHG